MLLKILCISSILSYVYAGRIQQYEPTRNIVSGEQVILPCSQPALSDFLSWKFQENGSEIIQDAGQIFPGGAQKIFNQFDLPPGRSTITGGMLTISNVQLRDEGDYWCEISSPTDPTVLSNKYPVHVWIKPQDPVVTQLHVNGSILEYTESPVARCSSKAGKPHSSVKWMNGTREVGIGKPVTEQNSFNSELWDISLDLILDNPTRFDHQRPFQCVVSHPSYRGEDKALNYSVNVLYHPVNIRMWANTTTLTVYCHADGFPEPTYNWVVPQVAGSSDDISGPELAVGNLFTLPGNDFFECIASNGIPDPVTLRVLVDNLRYPEGKPGWPWWMYAAIGGGALLLIVIVVVIICCCKRKGSKSSGSKAGGGAKYSKPKVSESGLRHSQPSLLEYDHMRTPDGRESSRPPSEVGYSKASMARAHSLEHIAEEKYGNNRDSVTLIPTRQMARDNMYTDSSLNRRASREELDKPYYGREPVADHIQVLSKSWDHLAQSREHLNRSREELHVDLPPRYQSQDDIRGSRENLASNEQNYPYADDTVDRRRDYREDARYNHQNYHHGNRYDENDGYYDDRGYGASSEQRDGASGGQYDDWRGQNSAGGYNQQQQQGYGGSRGYDDSTYRQDDRGYNSQSQQGRYDDRGYGSQSQQGYNQPRQSYGDSEFDEEDQGYDYNRSGFQPASMI